MFWLIEMFSSLKGYIGIKTCKESISSKRIENRKLVNSSTGRVFLMMENINKIHLKLWNKRETEHPIITSTGAGWHPLEGKGLSHYEARPDSSLLYPGPIPQCQSTGERRARGCCSGVECVCCVGGPGFNHRTAKYQGAGRKTKATSSHRVSVTCFVILTEPDS